ncbi:MAG: glycosyltransferase family 4 protein [Methylococcales bacterium]
MNVLHVFRAPVGGLFRHVCDLVEQQAKMGLNVGIVCDASTGADNAVNKLQQLEPYCKLGIHRLPMSRSLGVADVKVVQNLPELCKTMQLHIVHGHGAKGGAYGRFLAKRIKAKAIYTPHGGSLHYSMTNPVGAIYLTLERYLKKLTDGIIFESQFSADAYQKKIGALPCAHKVIHNGLREPEFSVLNRPNSKNQLVFVGEIRQLKGLDVLFQALALLKLGGLFLKKEAQTKLLVFGAGPDEDFFKKRVQELGLNHIVSFNPPIFPATEAFKQAQCVIIPSLAESFPYIVLEAAAAKVPLLTTKVGGIPEIFGPYADHLLPPGDADLLAKAIQETLDNNAAAEQFAGQLYDYVHDHFTFMQMVEKTVVFYQELLSE